MSRRIVLLLGVPGVGKTTLIQAYVARYPHWVRISAGDMVLRGTKSLITNRDSLRNRAKQQIYAEQMLISPSVQNELSTMPEDINILFDGHATLRTTRGELLPVRWKAFAGINPTEIILLEAPSEVIIARRMADASLRNREQETVEDLNIRQMLTERICRGYARLGNIPFTKLVMPTVDELYDILSRGETALPPSSPDAR